MTSIPDKPKVILLGVAGRMGQAISRRFMTDRKVDLVGACDMLDIGGPAFSHPDFVTSPPIIVPSINDLPANLDADLVLDFSSPDGTRANLEPIMERGWDLIIGATGHSETDIESFKILANKNARRIVLVPNFTLGVNLMFKFAEIASSVFEDVEIIEMHHEKKVDMPSGTAIHTAKLISDAIASQKNANKTEKIKSENIGSDKKDSGKSEIPIHSVRLPGYLAHQEVIFGSPGETLTIRHDTTDRSAFLSGIYLSILKIKKLPPGFHRGLIWAFD